MCRRTHACALAWNIHLSLLIFHICAIMNKGAKRLKTTETIGASFGAWAADTSLPLEGFLHHMGVVTPYAEAKKKVLQLILTDDSGDSFRVEGPEYEAKHWSEILCTGSCTPELFLWTERCPSLPRWYVWSKQVY